MQTEQWINSRCACAQLLMDRSDAEHHALIYTHIDCESQDIDHRYKQLIVYSMARPQRCESAYHTSFRAMIMQCAFQSDHHNPIQHHCRYRIDVVTRRMSCCIHTPPVRSGATAYPRSPPVRSLWRWLLPDVMAHLAHKQYIYIHVTIHPMSY